MSENKIKVPKQFYSMRGKYPAMMIDKVGGLPVILKELSGSKGKGLILLESPKQTNMTLESYFGSERKIILQEFLDNGGTDERHIVCGGKVVNSMRRHSPEDDIRANLSLSGTGEAITADTATAQMCIDAVNAIPGLNFAGVDIMKTTTDDGEEIRYFIEINSNPGEKIMDITGHNHYQDLLDYVESECKKRRANKKADTEEASRGAKTFDEAYTACKAFLERKK
jgi:ribosomal protein S6--L-glutamate ligase